MINKRIRTAAATLAVVAGVVSGGVLGVLAQSDATPTAPTTQDSTQADRGPGRGFGQRGGLPGLGRGAEAADSPTLIAIAGVLNLDVDTLIGDLQSGKTITDLATEQSVDIQTVYDAVIAKEKAGLDAEVSTGYITQAQADARLADLTANIGNSPMFNGNGPATRQMQSPKFAAIAAALNLDVDTLAADVQSGKTIAAIAAEQSVDIQTVYDAIIAQEKTLLDAQVSTGYLTQEQADARLADLTANIADSPLLNGGPGGRGPQGGFGPGNGGPQGGFGPGNGGPQGNHQGGDHGHGGPQGGFGPGNQQSGPQNGQPNTPQDAPAAEATPSV